MSEVGELQDEARFEEWQEATCGGTHAWNEHLTCEVGTNDFYQED